MTDEPLDPRIDRMMAALYGELSETEERGFRRLLEKDDALRAEFEELKGTREILGDWEVEERVPSFVLVDRAVAEPSSSSAKRRASAGPGWFERFREAARAFGRQPAWGLATAAVALLVLAIAGFRVEKLDGGVAFRFGEPTAPESAPFDDSVLDRIGDGRPLGEVAAGDGEMPVQAGKGKLVPVSSDGYLTQDEYDARSAELMISLASLLNDYGERRDEEVAELMNEFYVDTRSRQDSDFRDLNRRIDTLGFQFLRDSGFDPGQLNDQLNGRATDRSVPLELAPPRNTEE